MVSRNNFPFKDPFIFKTLVNLRAETNKKYSISVPHAQIPEDVKSYDLKKLSLLSHLTST
jgi:hypothetical protein